MTNDERQRYFRVKRAFLVLALLAIPATPALGLLLLSRLDPDDVSALNLAVDGVVGLFTIWGLFWAATQFAESRFRSKVHIGLGDPASTPIRGILRLPRYHLLSPSSPVTGLHNARLNSGAVESIPNVHVGVFLENAGTKPGRHVHLILHISASPMPESCKFTHADTRATNPLVTAELDRDGGTHQFMLQFSGDLVVHRDALLVGGLSIDWPMTIDTEVLPETISLKSTAYALDGAAEQELVLPVAWQLPPANGAA